MGRLHRSSTAIVGLAFAWCFSCQCRLAAGADAPPKGRLHFLGVAYDEGPPEGKTLDHFNYAPDNFSRLLKAQSPELFREIRVTTIKGGEVTHDRVIAVACALRRAAMPEDLVFIYWGTHGGTTRKGWSANAADGTQVYSSEIKRELSGLRCPAIAVVSTCGSGGFARAIPENAMLPPNAVAFCACRRRQSTGNELDMALREALAGFADSNGNGEVTVREALEYVPVRYAEWFPGQKKADAEQVPVLVPGNAAPLDRALTKVSSNFAAAVCDGRWYGVTILERQEGKAKVRFLGCDSTCKNGAYSLPDAVVSDEELDLPGGDPPLVVEWDGQWYPARIVKRSRSGVRIHYIGYPESDDETVTRNRMRFLFTERRGIRGERRGARE